MRKEISFIRNFVPWRPPEQSRETPPSQEISDAIRRLDYPTIKKLRQSGAKVDENQVRQRYRQAAEEDVPFEITSLMEATGVRLELPVEFVQKKAREWIIVGLTDYAILLSDLTRIEIILDNQTIEAGWRAVFRFAGLEQINKFRAFTGQEPAPEIIAESVKDLLKHGHLKQAVILSRATGAKINHETIDKTKLATLDPSDLDTILSRHPELAESIPWAGGIIRVSRGQRRSSRMEYDPWVKELDPLVAFAVQEKFLSLLNSADGELTAKFVKNFGMVNAPKIFRICLELWRSGQVGGLSADSMSLLQEAFGKRLKKFERVSALINEIQRMKQTLTHEIIADKTSPLLKTKLGAELLSSIFGATGYEEKDNPARIIGIFESARTRNPALFKLPSGYHEDDVRLAKAGQKERTISLSFVPSHGLLRIYARYLAGTCTIASQEQLAAGEFPNIHCLAFVTGRNTPRERLRGCTLLIETKTKTGEPIIIVRANNPRQNILSDLNTEQLIRAVLDEAIIIGMRRGIKNVGLPLDASPLSSSNRREVSEYYFKNFSSAPRIELENTAETNFNGYPIWNPRGPNPAVVIWKD
ncbi:MAG: hypothetical protein HW383_317 [Candidatus Magasanikbacteria bacterium]|nr:hypothetical protein [Candidatus Magasanikbacteria bacterium]